MFETATDEHLETSKMDYSWKLAKELKFLRVILNSNAEKKLLFAKLDKAAAAALF
jgi:hypothetical protein